MSFPSRRRSLAYATAVVTALLFGACGREPATLTKPTANGTTPLRITRPGGYNGTLWLCKLGPSSPTGAQYQFKVTASGGTFVYGTENGTDNVMTMKVFDGEAACQSGANGAALFYVQDGSIIHVKLEELPAANGATPQSWVLMWDNAAQDVITTFGPTTSIEFDLNTTGTVNGNLSDYKVTVNNAAVCTDQTATNFGGPLPCVFTPPPTPCPAGSFTFNFLQNGDLFIRYDQFPAPNDNSYGVNAVGWPNGHKFNDLVGSDHAGFQLVDGGGVVRLSFNVDYISANSSAPSGYASLGVTGGDGKMIVGTATGISATTSLARNLNGDNIPGLFNASHVQQFGSVNLFVDSPPTDPAHTTYNISDPSLAGWDFHDTYFVTISAAKLASIGFDPNTWQVAPNPDQLHNSPAKACPPSGDQLSITKYEVKDKQVKITLTNSGSAAVYLTGLTLTWPQGVNGNLVQVKMDGDIVYSGPAIGGGTASLTTAQLVADQNKRKIDHNSSDVYTLIFANNADANLANYTGTVTFGSTTLTVLPH